MALQPSTSPMAKSRLPVYSLEALEVFNMLTNPVWVMTYAPEKTRFVWSNEACQLSQKYTKDEMLKMDINRDLSPALKQQHDMYFHMIQCQEKSIGPTVQTLYPHGRPVTYEMILTPIRLKWRGQDQTVVLVNAYEKQDLQYSIQGELQRAREMQRHSQALVMLFRCRDGALLSYSPSAYAFYTKYSYFKDNHSVFEEVNLKDLLRFSTSSDDYTMNEVFDIVSAKKSTDPELVIEVMKTPFEASKKEIRWFRVEFVPILDPMTGETAVSVSEFDITQMKNAEEALRLKEVEQLDFFHHIVHELRTPLHGITNILATTLQRVPKPYRKNLNIVLSQSELLLGLVNDIMDAATSAKKDLTVARDRVNFNRVVQRCIAIMQPQVIGHKKLVDLVNNKHSVYYVTGDATRLQQVLTNLVGNAVKFTKSGTITVSAVDCNADAALRGEPVKPEFEGMLLVTVRDSGIGIAPDKLDHVFEDFHRGDEDDVRSIVGTGLGLSLCRALVEAHGGQIFVESQLNVGSAFSFTVPRNFDSASLRSPRTSTSSQGGGAVWRGYESERSSDGGEVIRRKRSGSETSVGSRDSVENLIRKLEEEKAKVSALKLRLESAESNTPHSLSRPSTELNLKQTLMAINDPVEASSGIVGVLCHSDLFNGEIEILSVDDVPSNQLVVENIVSTNMTNTKVTACMDGQSALDLLASREYLPDIVLLDVMMPGMSGYEVCETLRKIYDTSALPVIMVSAKNRKTAIIEGLQAGANDYITKPFDSNELVARIETQLRLKKVWRVELEAQRSNQLLQELLPKHIIHRLKKGERQIADHHEEVTILFSDIVSFTTLAQKLQTIEIVELLNNMFTAFDAKTDELGVYKVETIGDAYMIVAGHDGESDQDHAEKVFKFAKYMLEVCKRVPIPGGREHMGTKHIQIRIGIHSGTAHSGVVGEKMPRYCFFGDTVNTASRMESHGFPMVIHVSNTTYEHLKDKAKFHDYGERTIKGKGQMRTYIAEVGNYEAALRKRDAAKVLLVETNGQSPTQGDIRTAVARAEGASKMSSLRKAATDAQSHVADLQQQLAGTRSRLTDSVARSALFESEKDELVRKLVVVEKVRNDLETQTETLTSENSELRQQLARHQEKCEENESRLTNEIESLRQQLMQRQQQPVVTLSQPKYDSHNEDLDSERSVCLSPRHEITTDRRQPQSPLGRFLCGLGLEKYLHAFEREEICLELLPLLSNDQLKAIGVMSLGARLTIMQEAQRLEVSL